MDPSEGDPIRSGSTNTNSIDLKPELWSRLPKELLLLVMSEAKHSYCSSEESNLLLMTWKEITRGNKLLYAALLRQHYKEVVLDSSDPIMCPSEDYHLYTHDDPDLVRKCSNMTKGLKPNASTGLVMDLIRQDHGVYPAQFTRHLHLTFSLPYLVREDLLEVSHLAIGYTLDLLLPIMWSLQDIYIYGRPSDLILEAISKHSGTKLRKIHVGIANSFQYLSVVDQGANFDLYDWSRLTSLRNLTDLTILQVTEEYQHSLTHLISSLFSLRSLHLAPALLGRDIISGSAVSPLQVFLGHDSIVYDDSGPDVIPNLLTVLPCSLRCLDLIDIWYKGHCRLRIPVAPVVDSSLLSTCQLQELRVNIEDLDSAKAILSWLPRSALTRLQISPVLSSNSNTSPDSSRSALQVIQDIISSQRNSLNEIVMNNAWKIDKGFATEFNQHWDHSYSITDVVIGTESPVEPGCKEPHIEFKKKNLKHILYGCEMDFRRWGNSIERLRLELPWSTHDVDLEASDFLSYPSLPALRILILDQNKLDCRTKGYDLDEHLKIGETIINHAPDTLRYLRLCAHSFWVDRRRITTHVGTLEPQWRLISWYTALGHVEDRVRQDIKRWLTSEDEAFISDTSRLNMPRRDYGIHKLRLSRWNPATLGSQDLLIARRRH